MRKLIPVVVMAGVLAASAAVAPKANAQANYTNVSALRPFSPDANYMSLPGYLRYRFLVDSGRWISREEADEAVRQQGAPTGAPTG
ncbi:MAG TPA: hypothetical protein VF681_07465 [Abditibacteriaceae bacterium]|jgi:hypothetical protein